MRLAKTRMLRDVVEVCALVIAGAWGFYVFAYQNAILPSLASPTPTFIVRMSHVGNDGRLAVVRIDETVRDIGTTPIYFLAHAITVVGMNVTLRAPLANPKLSPGTVYEYSTFTGSTLVFRSIIVTHLGDPKQTVSMSLEPGQETTFSTEFYVPRGRFSRLVAFLVAGYSKRNSSIPTAITTSRSGLPGFLWSANDVFVVRKPAAELDLKAE